MAITLADLPPEFAAVDPALAAVWIEAAYGQIDAAKWRCAGANPDTGAKLLASHYLKSTGNGSDLSIAKTAIASKSIGGVSTSLALGAEASGDHGSTPYGRAFDGMLARVNSTRRRHILPILPGHRT